MAMRVYATAEQVEEFVGIAGATQPTLLRASTDVDRIVRSARYEVDPDTLMPVGVDLLELFARMTAEQVAWYGELGDETGIAAYAGGGSIGAVSLPRIGGSGAGSVEGGMLAPNAVQLARTSPLLTWGVRH